MVAVFPVRAIVGNWRKSPSCVYIIAPGDYVACAMSAPTVRY